MVIKNNIKWVCTGLSKKVIQDILVGESIETLLIMIQID